MIFNLFFLKQVQAVPPLKEKKSSHFQKLNGKTDTIQDLLRELLQK